MENQRKAKPQNKKRSAPAKGKKPGYGNGKRKNGNTVLDMKNPEIAAFVKSFKKRVQPA